MFFLSIVRLQIIKFEIKSGAEVVNFRSLHLQILKNIILISSSSEKKIQLPKGASTILYLSLFTLVVRGELKFKIMVKNKVKKAMPKTELMDIVVSASV